MGLMDLFNQGDMRDKLYAAAAKSDIPQGGVTGAAFHALFPQGLGNMLFGRNPEPVPDLASPQGTQYMADLAGNMMVPGTFIGPKGMSNLMGDDVARGLLSSAEAKLAQGVPREEVFRELGVFKGPEGKWRYEIDDKRSGWNFGEIAKIAEQHGGSIPKEYQGQLSDLYNHKQVFNAYPNARDITTQVRDLDNWQEHHGFTPGGQYSENIDRIEINAKNGATDRRSTLLHELQHAIQGREDFARGGSPKIFERGQMFSAKARDLNADLASHLTGVVSAQPQELFDLLKYGDPVELAAIAKKHGFNSIDDAVSYLKQEDAARTPFGQYQRVAGEAEARAVQDRAGMSMKERRSIFPEYATRNDLIIRGLMSGEF